MRNIYFVPVVFYLLTFLSISKSQILTDGVGLIPPSCQVKWTQAGLIPDITPTEADNVFIVNPPQAGVDWYPQIKSKIDSAKNVPGISIVYLPSGNYRIRSPIILDPTYNNIIIQGAGPDRTILEFEVGNNQKCFEISGSTSVPLLSLNNSINKGSKNIYATNLNQYFSSGDWIRFSEYWFDVHNDIDMPNEEDRWAQGCVGQITRLDSVTQNGGIMKDEASKYYDVNNDIRLYKINPVMNIGLENFKIKRIDTGYGEGGSNIKMKYAVNCWVKGVELEFTCENHIQIEYSSHIEVSGCYMNDARYHGPGGYGYGVSLAFSTTNCLIENNVFRRLRHSMIVSAGANCNVFTYNFATEQNWDGDEFYEWHPDGRGAEICLHGNYPYANLFEQNIVEQIQADGWNTPNGPYNAFVRNCIWDFEENHSFEMILVEAPNSSVLGCEINGINTCSLIYPSNDCDATTFCVDIYGMYNGAYRSHDYMVYHPHELAALMDVSYYYSSRPEFVTSEYKWPSVGPWYTELPNDSIPAEGRYFSGGLKTYLAHPTSKGNNTTSGELLWDETWTDGHTLSGNVTVQDNVILTIASNATIYLNGYYVKCVGDGQIIRQNNVTIQPKDIQVKSGSTIKGLYPTISSAVANAVSGQTVYLAPGTYYETVYMKRVKRCILPRALITKLST